MICPNCNTANQFKAEGKYVHCIAKPGGILCGFRLNDEDAKKYFIENNNRKRRIDYFYRRYKKKKKEIEGITINEIAMMKFCHRDTVYHNIKSFDVIPGSKPVRIRFNKKVLYWMPENRKSEVSSQ